MLKLFMVQGARLPSSTKKLAKVNMPSTYFGLGKSKEVKEFLLKIEIYYIVQRFKEDDKVSIALTFMKHHVF